MNPDIIRQRHRIFPDPAKIATTREANITVLVVFNDLVARTKRAIADWTDPENDAFAIVETNNRRAAEMLIDALRKDGYAADLHWHSTDDKIAVQLALYQVKLSRAHSDPRYP